MGKTIVVVGGAGHIGSHLVEKLSKKRSDTVHVIDNLSNGIEKNLPKRKNVIFHRANAQDIFMVLVEVKDVDIVYHLGEYARVQQSLDEPDYVMVNNLFGTMAVIEYCKQNNVKLVYSASSTFFFDKNETPYTFTKSVAVELIKNYAKWYELKYAIAYFSNVFGGREVNKGKYATLIGKFLYNYWHKKPLTVYGGEQMRNFTYIDDTISALELIGEKGEGDGYVIANPKKWSVLEVARMFPNAKLEISDESGGRTGDIELDTSMTQALGWNRDFVELDQYIKERVEK